MPLVKRTDQRYKGYTDILKDPEAGRNISIVQNKYIKVHDPFINREKTLTVLELRYKMVSKERWKLTGQIDLFRLINSIQRP